MRGNNLNDLKNNINNAEDKNKTDSGEKIAPIGRNLCIALVALCVVNIIAHLACYSRLPENVPIHWGADGSVNGYGCAWDFSSSSRRWTPREKTT